MKIPGVRRLPVAVALALLLNAAGWGVARAADDVTAGVTVNGIVVPEARIADEERYIIGQKQFIHAVSDQTRVAARAEALDKVIVWEIVRQKLKGAGRQVTEAEVDLEVAADRKRIGDAFAKYIGILGQDEESYRRRKACVLNFKRYTSEFIPAAKSVSDEEVRALYEAEPGRGASLEQAAPGIRELLLRRKNDALLAEDVARLKKQADVRLPQGTDGKIY